MSVIQRGVIPAYIFTWIFLLLFTYPFAVIPFQSVSLHYHISIPSEFILTLGAVAVILSTSHSRSWFLTLIIVIFVASVGFNFVLYRSYEIESIVLIGYMLIPYAIAIVISQHSSIDFYSISKFGFFFWLSQILHGLWSLSNGDEVIGFAGNRNWMASLLLSLSPWAYGYTKYLISLQRLNFTEKSPIKNSLSSFISLCLTAIPTLYLLQHCASRGAWLSLFSICLLVILVKFFSAIKKRISLITAHGFVIHLSLLLIGILSFCLLGLIIITLISVSLSPSNIRKIQTAIKEDVRLPLWSATIKLIADHDWITDRLSVILKGNAADSTPLRSVLGVGPGQFTKHIAEYRSRSSYHERSVSAPVTIHPHNEFLNIASQIGILAAVAWLLGLYPLIKNLNAESGLYQYACWSGLAVYLHGFFDMTLVQPPVNLVGFFCLGIGWKKCWFTTPCRDQMKNGWLRIIHNLLIIIICTVLIVIGTIGGWMDIKTDVNIRKGLIADARGEYAQASSYYRQAIHYQPKNLKAYLYLASVELDHLHHPRTALTYLLTAHALDPDFSHINERIFKAYNLIGELDKGFPYIIRECQLYPASISAFQLYFISLVFKEDFNRLNLVDERLRKLYLNNVSLGLNEEMILNTLREWGVELLSNNQEKCLRSAFVMGQNINLGFIDPLYFFIFSGRDDTIINSHQFVATDYAYWRELGLLLDLRNRMMDHAPITSMSDDEFIDKIRLFFNQFIRINSEDQQIISPSQVWARHGGNLISCLGFAHAVIYQCGFDPFLIIDENQNPLRFILVKNKRIWELQCEVLLQQNNWVWEEQKSIALAASERAVMMFQPEEFLLKNQIIGTIISFYKEKEFPRFDEIPILRLLQVLKFLDPDKTDIHLEDLEALCYKIYIRNLR